MILTASIGCGFGTGFADLYTTGPVLYQPQDGHCIDPPFSLCPTQPLQIVVNTNHSIFWSFLRYF